MAIKIHHGPDGTYKTSGAIKDDIIPLIKSGRTLVTNVRGFSRENAVKVLGKKLVHKDFKVIFLDTELEAGRAKFARFFHWAPNGAFFVVDEVQRIFKPKWRQKDLDELSIYVGDDKVTTEERPEDIETAWDMQRHYNWDFVFTTTSITKVRAEMKDMAKVAIRHYNLGLWRFYKTVEHATDSKGTSKSTQGSVRLFNWVPKKVFSLYASTKTGSFNNTEPRTAFWKDPKLVGLVGFLVIFWGYLLTKPVPRALGGDGSTAIEQITSDEQQVSETVSQDTVQINSAKTVSTDNLDVSNNKFVQDDFLNSAYITGSVYSTDSDKVYTFEANYKNRELYFTTMDLQDMGYDVRWIKPCKAAVINNNRTSYIYCSSNTFIKQFNDEQEQTDV